MSTTPKTSITIDIKGNSYPVKFPTTGQMIDINVYKSQISRNQYDYLKFSLDAEMQKISVVIDTIATFRSLIPDLTKDLNIKSVFELQISESAELVAAYENTYLPWYEEWLTFLKNPKGDENAQ